MPWCWWHGAGDLSCAESPSGSALGRSPPAPPAGGKGLGCDRCARGTLSKEGGHRGFLLQAAARSGCGPSALPVYLSPGGKQEEQKKKTNKNKPKSALKHRLLSPWLARVGHGAAGTMAGDASAGSGHLAPAWHELEASRERRAQDRSCWHAGKAPACPVHLVAPLGVRDACFHLQGEKQSGALGCTPGSTEHP